LPVTLILASPLVSAEIAIEPIFPVTRAFIGDWYALVYYFLLFLSGFFLITIGQPFWKAMDKIKGIALLAGLVSYQIFWWLWTTYNDHVLIPVFKSVVWIEKKVPNCGKQGVDSLKPTSCMSNDDSMLWCVKAGGSSLYA